MRKIYGAFVGFAGRGEMIPNEDSYCEIDPDSGGRVGHSGAEIPLQVEPGRDPAGQARAGDFQRDHPGGGRRGDPQLGPGEQLGHSPGGEIIHEVGATQMGDDPESRVLNQYCQAWDCKNLFITDGAPFVSNADKNPTLTIMALGWRTSEYVATR